MTPSPPATARRRGARLAARAQVRLLGASILVIFGSLLPWVSTPFGNIGGARGAGLWTLYAGVAGIAGALIPSRRLALAHAAVLTVVALALPAWQFIHLMRIGADTGSFTVAVPGLGLVLVAAGGGLAAQAAARLYRDR